VGGTGVPPVILVQARRPPHNADLMNITCLTRLWYHTSWYTNWASFLNLTALEVNPRPRSLSGGRSYRNGGEKQSGPGAALDRLSTAAVSSALRRIARYRLLSCGRSFASSALLAEQKWGPRRGIRHTRSRNQLSSVCGMFGPCNRRGTRMFRFGSLHKARKPKNRVFVRNLGTLQTQV
jgi:hypothetical protein